ncbi:MAG: CARDB domain-containing protein [Candidatus Heimdallarchaeota archaeon]
MRQSTIWFCLVIIVPIILGTMPSCKKPDLVVEDVDVEWNTNSKKASAVVKNLGDADATEFAIYFTPSECPVSLNRRPQISQTVTSLNVSSTVTIEVDFLSLSHPDNDNLANVRGVEVTADPKNTIEEQNENNNKKSVPLPDISGLPNYKYNEGLATVLRGIQIDDDVARNLNILPGYYHIREFRVSGQPSQKSITLSIQNDYYESVSGTSNLPERDHEWVFSNVLEDSHTSVGKKFFGLDLHGHTLSFEIQFGSPCVNVVSSQLDCMDVNISTQTYTTGLLNTCGWTTEPVWTIP